jgi:ArsR family transcriptional regulator
MDTESALAVLSALSQSTRLEIFRLLVRHEPDGLPAGDVARRLELPQNTVSVHLATLTRAGLLTSQRHSRLIIYRACLPRLQDLMSFLVKDCCAGSPELCASVITDLSTCCPGKETRS